MRRMSRGIIIFIITVFLLTMFTAGAAAALKTKTYTLDEIGMTVDVPTDAYAITRDIKEDDPFLKKFNTSKDEINSTMLTDNTFLTVVSRDLSYEIDIQAQEHIASNTGDLSTTDLAEYEAFTVEEFMSSNYTVKSHEIYESLHTVFIKLLCDYTDGDETKSAVYYCANYNDNQYLISLRPTNSGISTEQAEIIEKVIDSIQFTVSPVEAASEPIQTKEYAYADKDTQVSFTVPANWESIPTTADDHINALFNCKGGTYATMEYIFTNLYDITSEEQHFGLSRADYNSSNLTVSDIAKLNDMSESNITKVTYNGLDFFKTVLTEDYYKSIGLSALYSNSIEYAYFIDGNMYEFTLSGKDLTPYINDFEALMQSVKFPETAMLKVTASAAPTSQFAAGEVTPAGTAAAGETGSAPAIDVLRLILTFIIGVAPIAVYRFTVRRAPAAKRSAILITAIYGVAFLAADTAVTLILGGSFITTGIIIVCGGVNYLMLRAGAKRLVSQGTE